MKKIVSAILSVAMIVPMLCSCGNKEEEKTLSYEDLVNTDWSKYIEICDYKSIELDMYPEVTDSMLQSQITSLLVKSAEKNEITDRAAKEGDTVNIDFVGYHNGEKFAGGSLSDYDLVLGSKALIDGFESGLVGHSAGEKVSLNLTFPDPYKNNPDLAGEEVVFEVTINKVYEVIYPEFNDEFVKTLTESKYQTAEEYKVHLKKDLEKEKHEEMVKYKSSYAFSEIIDNSKFSDVENDELTTQLYDKFYNDMINYYNELAKDVDLELEEFLQKYYGATEQNLITEAEEYGKEAAEQIKVLFRIAQIENLFVTEENYEEAALEYAKSVGLTSLEELEEEMTKDDIKIDIVTSKALNFISDAIIETGEYSDGTKDIENSDEADNNGEETPEETTPEE